MEYLLHIETATPVCSVALSLEGKVVALKETSEENSHSSLLTVFIQELFKEVNIDASHLKAVSVSGGPGSYTGLRIGSSTAKGLCYALNIPLISIPTLKAMAKGFLLKNKPEGDDLLLCPTLDAKRMEIYYALYDLYLKEIKPAAVGVLTSEFLDNYRKKVIHLFGTGAEKCKQIPFANNIKVTDGGYNSAIFHVPVAYEKFIAKNFENIAYYEPFYLKEFYTGNKGNSKQ